MKNFLNSRASGVAFVLLLLAAWQTVIVTGLYESASLPSVSSILQKWWELVMDGTLPSELFVTLRRMFIGYAVAVGVGVVVGVAMGYSRFFFNLLEPLVELLRPVPSPAYIPLAILFFGLGESMKIFVVAFACVFPVLLNTYEAIRSIDPVLTDTGRTFGASRRQAIRTIYLPAATPGILTGMRISLGISLIVVVIAEMVASERGIGTFILSSQRLFQVPSMFAGIFTLAVVGYLLNQVLVQSQKYLLRWAPTENASEKRR
jgi:ABC-type nitrate/sulfonate/bicarbonate transport system permease component